MDTQGVDIPREEVPDENMEAARAEAEAEGQPQPDEPKKFAGKYESPEDLEKAYLELQQKLGSKPEAKSEEEAGPAFQIGKEGGEKGEAESAPFDAKQVEQEFMETGKLSDDTRASLTKAGLPESWIDTHEAGLQALRDARSAAINGWFGGEDRMESVLKWADANLSDAEIRAIESAANSSDIGTSEAAIRGLIARYDTSPMGASGVEGTTGGSTVKPFRSNEEMVVAMNDPRYRKDPAYQKEIEARIAVT